MTYTVYYKESGFLKFWKKVSKVKGDGILESNTHRFLILEDESRLELPITFCFKFSKERFLSIKQRMSEEAGQEIQIKKG